MRRSPDFEIPCGYRLLEQWKPSYVDEFWGWCGTAEVEASWTCPPCLRGEVHGWHHTFGMPPNSEDHWKWERDGASFPIP